MDQQNEQNTYYREALYSTVSMWVEMQEIWNFMITIGTKIKNVV